MDERYGVAELGRTYGDPVDTANEAEDGRFGGAETIRIAPSAWSVWSVLVDALTGICCCRCRRDWSATPTGACDAIGANFLRFFSFGSRVCVRRATGPNAVRKLEQA